VFPLSIGNEPLSTPSESVQPAQAQIPSKDCLRRLTYWRPAEPRADKHSPHSSNRSSLRASSAGSSNTPDAPCLGSSQGAYRSTRKGEGGQRL